MSKDNTIGESVRSELGNNKTSLIPNPLKGFSIILKNNLTRACEISAIKMSEIAASALAIFKSLK